MKKLLLPLLTILFVIYFLANPAQAMAAGSLSLSPNAKSVPQGTNFTISVGVNTQGEPVNAVQVNLSYPPEKLDFVGVSSSGSAFEIQAEGSGGGGLVKISRGTVSAKSGILRVANVTFRAKVNAGSATVSFAGGSSAVVRSTDNANIYGGGGGGTYSFGSPSVQSTPALTPSPQGPVNITDVNVVDLGKNSASISWKTNVPTTSLIEYGLSEKLGITASDSVLAINHKLSLESKLLSPGTKYYFQIKSNNEADVESTSKVESFITKGFKVLITVLSSNGKPLADQKILLFNDYPQGTTDKEGLAEFNDVSIGLHSVHIKIGGRTFGDEIDVKEASLESPQNFTIRVTEGFGINLIKYALISVMGLLILIIVFLVCKYKFKKKINSEFPPDA